MSKYSVIVALGVAFLVGGCGCDPGMDGVPDFTPDQCTNTTAGQSVDVNGCSCSQLDTDGDGVDDCSDQCPGTPTGIPVLSNGCPETDPIDPDGDGVPDVQDGCPDTPAGEPVDANGCSCTQLDSDGDGVKDCNDQCPGTPGGTPVGENGCPTTTDSDSDGVPDGQDQCPNTPSGEPVNANGCSCSQVDGDSDGVNDCDDQCPGTSQGQAPGCGGCVCGQLTGATRFLGVDCYAIVQPVPVCIMVCAPGGTTAVGLEDAPPAGWSVANISNGGQWDAVNQKVKWGPFFDPIPATVSYEAIPPTGTTGNQCFNGTVSYDGGNNAVNDTACLVNCP